MGRPLASIPMNTHHLPASGAYKDRPQPIPRSSIACQQHVVHHNINMTLWSKVDAICQVLNNPQTMGRSPSSIQREHPPAASTWNIHRWSAIGNQEQHILSATCGALWRQTCGRGTSKRCKSARKPCTYHALTSALHPNEHSLAVTPLKKLRWQSTDK